MFARHIPPSGGRPRVLVLNDDPTVDLPEAVEAVQPGAASGSLDAVVGYAAPDPTLDNLEAFFQQLRPGGRLILAARADPRALLEALVQGGYHHCLVEAQPGDWVLYRGERPGAAELQDLAAQTAGSGLDTPFRYIPVEQTPNKPVWRLSPGETLTWRAPTVRDEDTGEDRLLVFSSLVRAVAFMQKAVLAGAILGINKVVKYRSAQVAGWRRPFLINPTFHDVRHRARGPAIDLDLAAAEAGGE